MVARQDICLRRLGEGRRAREVGFHRLLSNDKVTIERLIEGWSEQTVSAVAGRHVLAIQDTSEITFATTPGRRRGLGEIGKGRGRGVLVHAMVAVDAASGGCLGLVAGSVYIRKGRIKTPHAKRALEDKESRRWIDTAVQAKSVLAEAATVTIVADRESDVYANWATLPGGNVHLLTRVMHDRAVVGGGTLSKVAAALPFVATRRLELLATHKRAARKTEVSLRFGKVDVCRPDNPGAKGLPKSVSVNFVDVVDLAGVEPVHWRLLTTHEVGDAATAWQIVDWYRRRWTIEQLFRLMKTHGLRLEDSQLASADVLIKLAAIATKAAVVILQLVQARDGQGGEPAGNAFSPSEIAVLDSLDASYQGRTVLQSDPHRRHSLAWAAWTHCTPWRMGRLSILQTARAYHITPRARILPRHRQGLGTLRDVCMP
ncbi:IS4 family transposase [Sinorhizobium meliloti]|uniref:IS4 family transposase n=2 Tax=Rhizobium meliloti TaxID=382 RepID=UPI0002A569C7|nr:IS4 family transposase [Sinorhizobium meliloti]AGA10946.1 Transposase DDE domain protein [Sinorhizobium meliloti GR4]